MKLFFILYFSVLEAVLLVHAWTTFGWLAWVDIGLAVVTIWVLTLFAHTEAEVKMEQRKK